MESVTRLGCIIAKLFAQRTCAKLFAHVRCAKVFFALVHGRAVVHIGCKIPHIGDSRMFVFFEAICIFKNVCFLREKHTFLNVQFSSKKTQILECVIFLKETHILEIISAPRSGAIFFLCATAPPVFGFFFFHTAPLRRSIFVRYFFFNFPCAVRQRALRPKFYFF